MMILDSGLLFFGPPCMSDPQYASHMINDVSAPSWRQLKRFNGDSWQCLRFGATLY